jgi:hypothetical protein
VESEPICRRAAWLLWRPSCSHIQSGWARVAGHCGDHGGLHANSNQGVCQGFFSTQTAGNMQAAPGATSESILQQVIMTLQSANSDQGLERHVKELQQLAAASLASANKAKLSETAPDNTSAAEDKLEVIEELPALTSFGKGDCSIKPASKKNSTKSFCYRCHIKGHAKSECTTELYCDIMQGIDVHRGRK